MKPELKENLKVLWMYTCMAITVMPGVAYAYYFDPRDGANMNVQINYVLSTFGFSGGIGVILFCISVLAVLLHNMSKWPPDEEDE